MWRKLGILVVGLFVLVGCSGGGEEGGSDTTAATTTTGSNATVGSTDKALAGNWRVISAVLYYDDGRNTKDLKATLPTRRLTVGEDGSWQFGSSSGTWTVSTVEDADWKGWGVTAYGPTRKLTVNGWADGTSKGPIEESTGPVDFFWVIYPYISDTSGGATMWMKFGKE